jgi:hypothetical protein
MNESPQFKIHGLERRKLKHELSASKSFLKNFWYMHQMEKDMVGFYGGDLMSDECAQSLYEQTEKKIKELELKLNVPYGS